MKLLKFVFFLVTTACIVSCSSDGDGGNGGSSNSLTINGSSVSILTTIAQRSEDSFLILAYATDGTSIQVSFNKFGNLERVIFEDEDFNLYSNYQYFKSNYFNFDLVSLNENNKRVKVTYSGTLYENENDFDSPSITVNGSFDLNYVEQAPLVSGLGLSCKIAGNDWHETDFWDTSFLSVRRKFINDDDKLISMSLTSSEIAPGTYSINLLSDNKMELDVFNTTTLEYDPYLTTSGTITIISNTFPTPGVRVIEGTFNFTAVNPFNNNTVQVTQGKFKSNF